MAATILQLSELISSSVASLVKTCEESKVPLPDLNEPFTPASEAFRANPTVADTANIIGAAALQLAAIILPPQETLFHNVSGHVKSGALRVALQSNVPEILREAGPEGTHVDKISAQCDIDKDKLARILRSLCNRHIFREVTPDVFANNRISGMLDTQKPSKELFADPESKHDGTPGFAALVEYFLTDGHISTACLLENLRDPKTARSQEPNHAPLQRALGIDQTLWDFVQKPEQSYRRRRFGISMGGIAAMEPADAILKAYDWSTIPHGGTIVDVGGGIGTIDLSLNAAHPDLNLIIEDRPEIVEDGLKIWQEKRPEALTSGRVKFLEHDFLKPQPGSILSPSVFILKNILHDWPDAYNARILTHLRTSAGPYTVLVIIGSIMAHACHDSSLEGENSTPGAALKEAPRPLLPNYGAANDMAYTLDMAMLMWHNAQEYTINHLSRLLQASGWRISTIRRSDGMTGSNFLDAVHAVPL